MVSASHLTDLQLYVQFDIWVKGNVSPIQLSDKLQGALRHSLCDVIMELRVLPNPLCLGVLSPVTKAQKEAKGKLITKWLLICIKRIFQETNFRLEKHHCPLLPQC